MSTCVLILLTIAGLSGPVPQRVDRSEAERALTEAEARWQANRPKEYEFTVHLWCDCPAARSAPVRFRVSGDAGTPVKTLNQELQRAYEGYTTIDAVLASVRRSMSFPGLRSPMKFQKTFGYPEAADFNELSVRVTDFKVITQ